jgi:hypothetical protein
MNDVIMSLGGVSRITAPCSLNADNNELAKHLAMEVEGKIFTVAEIRNQIPIYQAMVNALQVKQFLPLNPAQVRLVLNQFGLLDTVESAIKAGDKSLQIEWDYRTEFARDNDLLLSMAKSLNINDKQLDAMFEAGALL